MPMLTPMPPATGAGVSASPPGDAITANEARAQAAGGESREGNPTTDKQNTWTRLFQSLLNQDNSIQGTPATGSKAAVPTRTKGKDSGVGQNTPSPAALPFPVPVAPLPPAEAPANPAPAQSPAVQTLAGLPGSGSLSPAGIEPVSASDPQATAVNSEASADDPAAIPQQPANGANGAQNPIFDTLAADQAITVMPPRQVQIGPGNRLNRAAGDPAEDTAGATDTAPTPGTPFTPAAPPTPGAAPAGPAFALPPGRAVDQTLSPLGKEKSTLGNTEITSQSASEGAPHPSPASGQSAAIGDRIASDNSHAGILPAKAKTADSEEPEDKAPAGQDSTSAGAGNTGLTAGSGTTTSATNTAPVQSSSQAERIDVIRQIASQATGLKPADPQSNTITMRIHPEHWGQMTISVSLAPGKADAAGAQGDPMVYATLVTSDPSARDALQAHMQDLSRALNGAGFHVDKVEVVTQSATAASPGQGGSGFHQGQNGTGGGFTPNQQGLSAQTNGGGGNHQNAPFGAALGQQPGDQRQQNTYAASQIAAGAGDADSAQPAAATIPLARGRIDYRI